MIARLPRYYLARRFNSRRLPLPMNYTLSVTNRCNSRCRTCNIWTEGKVAELTLEEWIRVFEGLGQSPYWVTLSGGEPFLREDLIEIHDALCEMCRPAIVNVASNGLQPERIAEWVWEMSLRHQEVKLVVNLSVDHHVSERHDEIRGVPGAFARVMETYRRLSALELHNLTVGIHTVISAYNVADFPEICQNLCELAPTQYIAEVAEQRVELGTVGLPITPNAEQYILAEASLMRQMMDNHWHGLARLTMGFRGEYYRNVGQWLRNPRQVIPCYAGWASAHVAPQGDIWFCCIKAMPIGNLRDADYSFSALWGNGTAGRIREIIRRGECHCPMANASYTNMLMHPPTLARVLKSVAKG